MTAQIKILYNNECTKKSTSNSYIYTKNLQTGQILYKVETKNVLELEMYVFCTYKQCTNYKKLI